MRAESTHLFESALQRAFNRLTRLAGRFLDTPTALITLVEERRQLLEGALELVQAPESHRETPFTRSLCQLAVRTRALFSVCDLREHPELSESLGAPECRVMACAGVPLVVEGEAIGVFSVMDENPRRWTAEQLQTLQDLADCAVSEIELRLALLDAQNQRALTNAVIESVGDPSSQWIRTASS